jgi:hypothetical protein
MKFNKLGMPDTPVRLSDLDVLNAGERQLRMNLRNAWMAEPARGVRLRAIELAGQGRRFEALVLLELACDIYAESDE